MTPPALVLIDLQMAADDPGWGPRNNPDAEANIAALLAGWRAASAPVYHVRHDSIEPGSPYRPGQPGHDFKPEAMPIAGEPVTGKQTNSPFIATGLEQTLRKAGHNRLVISGVLTSNCVEMTVRHAGNLGFDVYVVADACWAVDTRDFNGRVWPANDVHALSLANMDGEYATISDTKAVLALLQTA